MERKRNETTSQARLPGMSEDVKKKLRFLSEVEPCGSVKRSLETSCTIKKIKAARLSGLVFF